MMVSGQRIRQIIDHGELTFSGTVRGDSLLLTLGDQLLNFQGTGRLVEAWEAASVMSAYSDQMDGWEEYDLSPLSSVLISAKEYLHMPEYLSATIGTLSHVARLGLFAHFSSPFVDPLYSGYLTLELFNASPHFLRLRPGMAVAKLIISEVAGRDPETESCPNPFYYSSPPSLKPKLMSRYFEEFSKPGEKE
ncbi:hypothetical protein ACFLU6_02045 [Acidobacteriota bacterium]